MPRHIGKGSAKARVSHKRRPRGDPGVSADRLTRRDYQALSEFRYLLRRSLGFSEQAANAAGLTSRQHQALLAIKGFRKPDGLTIQALAERLCVRHHSAVELVDRLVEGGLAVRCPDPRDRRRVLLRLSPLAERRLARLSATHLQELQRLGPALLQILDSVGQQVSE